MDDLIVIGGGISGLAAAWYAQAAGLRVRVLEADDQAGGKLRSAALGPHLVDVGAEAFLIRRPEAHDLILHCGMGADVVSPATIQATIAYAGGIHLLPTGTLMGVPQYESGLQGLLDETEIQEFLSLASAPLAPLEEDTDVAAWVEQHAGRAVLDRIVEPLLGGVYAGHANRLSLQATAPMLSQAAAAQQTLLKSGQAPAPAAPGDVFAGLRGGLGQLPWRLALALNDSGVPVHLKTPARSVQQQTDGSWNVNVDRVETGAAESSSLSRSLIPQPTSFQARTVLVATPAPTSAALLCDAAPRICELLRRIEVADVAVIALLVDRADLAHLTGSGVLIPPSENRFIKAATYSCAKWQWTNDLDADHVVLRLSVGRAGEDQIHQFTDDEMADCAIADFEDLTGTKLHLHARVVQRWPAALPQYNVGHRSLIDEIYAEAAQLPGLMLAGAAFEGVGIPACIATAQNAVQQVLDHLKGRCATATQTLSNQMPQQEKVNRD